MKSVASAFPSNIDKKTVDGEAEVRVCNYTDVYYNEQIYDQMPFLTASASEEQIRKFTLRAGDTIITKDSETADDIATAAFVPNDLEGVVCGYHLTVVRPTGRADGRFLKRYFDTHFARAYFGTRANGLTRVGLSQYPLANAPVALPPMEEQRAIARFLDRETAKIDELVAAQEDLIRLLKEKRQVVISHAVTKGLNPNAPLKPSGIEWLGDIPVHWNRVQLGRVCTKVSDGPHFSPKYVDDGVMFISARNIRIDGWSLHDAKYVSEEDCAEFDKRVVPARGDVLYTKGGTTGVARVVDFDDRFQVWVHVAVLKIDQEIADPFFIAYALNSTGGYEQSQLHTRGATNKDLGLTRMTQIWITCPDLHEQRKIVGHLNRRTAQLDRLSVEAARTIDLLKERRAALISAAVTGKIDVRGEVDMSEDEAIPA